MNNIKIQFNFLKQAFSVLAIGVALTGLLSCGDDEDGTDPVRPTITSFEPVAGAVGESVTITGTNFSADLADNAVWINGLPTTVTAATETTITATVPENALTGAITVQVKGVGVTSATDFVVIIKVESFAPTSGDPGTEVTITGKGFSATAGENIVRFGAVKAEVTAATSTSITAIVPEAAYTGPVSVQVKDGIGISSTNFVRNSPITLKIRIADQADDAEEGINGTEPGDMDIDSSDLEFGEIEGDKRGHQMVGLRFTGVTVPKGAKITSASIQFAADEDTSNDPVVLTISAEATDNPAAYKDAEKNISSRSLGSASVEWDVPAWVKGDAGDAQKTADLTSIIEEAIGRSGWIVGKSINFIFKPTEQTLGNPKGSGRVAESFSTPDKAPELTIVFEFEP